MYFNARIKLWYRGSDAARDGGGKGGVECSHIWPDAGLVAGKPTHFLAVLVIYGAFFCFESAGAHFHLIKGNVPSVGTLYVLSSSGRFLACCPVVQTRSATQSSWWLAINWHAAMGVAGNLQKRCFSPSQLNTGEGYHTSPFEIKSEVVVSTWDIQG